MGSDPPRTQKIATLQKELDRVIWSSSVLGMETNPTTLLSGDSVKTSAAFDIQRLAASALDSATLSGSCDMLSSAGLCLDDSFSLAESGHYSRAARRAIDSLEYSVGIFSQEHRKAIALLG